jgi:hypothetical protein
VTMGFASFLDTLILGLKGHFRTDYFGFLSHPFRFIPDRPNILRFAQLNARSWPKVGAVIDR